MEIIDIAKVAHEVNRAFCLSNGDDSHAPWEDTSLKIKESVIFGVISHIDNPDLTPEQSHQNWYEYKQKEGWVYGEVKDEVLKTHPCFLPYNQLPTTNKSKDYIFTAIVKQLKDA